MKIIKGLVVLLFVLLFVKQANAFSVSPTGTALPAGVATISTYITSYPIILLAD